MIHVHQLFIDFICCSLDQDNKTEVKNENELKDAKTLRGLVTDNG